MIKNLNNKIIKITEKQLRKAIEKHIPFIEERIALLKELGL